MTIIPTLTVTSAADGTVTDLSGLFMSSHSEQTTSDKKDENKYDVTLANAAGQLFSKFAPKDKIRLSVVNDRKTCLGPNPTTINIFVGEIQKISADEEECKIEGSCDQGGFVDHCPAGGIDQKGRRFHQTELAFSDQVMGRFIEWNVE